MRIEIDNDELYILDVIGNYAEIYNDGGKFSYNNKSQYHNVDGPAFEFGDGDESWYFDGHIHRRYGPARKWRSGDKWYFGGEEYTQEEFMEKFL